MGYELTLALKTGTLEIEFDTLDELEEKLDALDLPRIERAVRAARRRKGPARASAPKTRAKRATTRKRASA